MYVKHITYSCILACVYTYNQTVRSAVCFSRKSTVDKSTYIHIVLYISIYVHMHMLNKYSKYCISNILYTQYIRSIQHIQYIEQIQYIHDSIYSIWVLSVCSKQTIYSICSFCKQKHYSTS